MTMTKIFVMVTVSLLFKLPLLFGFLHLLRSSSLHWVATATCLARPRGRNKKYGYDRMALFLLPKTAWAFHFGNHHHRQQLQQSHYQSQSAFCHCGGYEGFFVPPKPTLQRSSIFVQSQTHTKWNGMGSSFSHISTIPKTLWTTTTTALGFSSSSNNNNDKLFFGGEETNKKNNGHEEEENDRFSTANVAGVSVSPNGFLVLLQTNHLDSCSHDLDGNFVNDDNNNRDDHQETRPLSLGSESKNARNARFMFPILLTTSSSPPAEDSYSSFTSTSSNLYSTADHGIPANSSDSSNTIDVTKLPDLFQSLNNNMDQTSVSSPEALTYLQLLNGVDMATPILPPDILSLVCVWYAFMLMEEGSWKDHGDGSMENGKQQQLVVVEDELGLGDNNTDRNNNFMAENDENILCTYKFQNAVDYICAMVRTTLPPPPNGIRFGDGTSSVNIATSFLEASPGQRSKVQLPRVWLRGIRLQEMSEVGEDGLDMEMDREFVFGTPTDDYSTMTSIGQIPIRLTLECSVDDGSKLLEIPLFALPKKLSSLPSSSLSSSLSTTRGEKTTSHLVEERSIEISNELLQELSHNYKIESSASFLSLALFQRYNNRSSSNNWIGGSNTGSNSVPKIRVSSNLMKRLVAMQERQQTTSEDDGGVSAKLKYCWVLPAIEDSTKNNVDNADSIIRSQGLPFYRSLSQVQDEGQQHGVWKQDKGSDQTNNTGRDIVNNIDRGDSEARRRKVKPLTLEQQAKQQSLVSAWKIACQRQDTGAIERIQKAMADLEKEVTYDDDDPDEEVEKETTLAIIQRAMQWNIDDSDEALGLQGDTDLDNSIRMMPQDDDIVGLISELEDASIGDDVDMGDNER